MGIEEKAIERTDDFLKKFFTPFLYISNEIYDLRCMADNKLNDKDIYQKDFLNEQLTIREQRRLNIISDMRHDLNKELRILYKNEIVLKIIIGILIFTIVCLLLSI